MRHASLLAAALALAATQASGAEDAPKERPPVLAKHIRAGVTFESYLQQVMQPVRQAFGTRGVIEVATIDRLRRKSLAAARVAGIAAYAPFDRDGDGKVTPKEIEETLAETFDPAEGTGRFRSPGDTVRDLMRADTDGDGAVDRAETIAHAERSMGTPHLKDGLLISEYLMLSPDRKLTARGLVEMARTTFDEADTDRNTVISEDEAKAFAPPPRIQRDQPGRRGREMEACVAPKVIEGSKLVLYGTSGSDRQATVSLAGDNGDETHVVDVTIEPGEEQLYVVLTSYQSTLWRFSGEVDRVVRVLPTATRRADNSGAGAGGSGVTGVPKDRVSFLESVRCLPSFTALESVEEARTRGALADLVGRQPDIKGAAPAARTVSIPSMVTEPPNRRGGWDPLPVVDVDPSTVVAAVPVKRFDLLPGKPGIDQLLERGDIVRLKGSDGYRIVRAFPRFPTGLTGGSQPSFLLGKGVPMPAGSTGWSCVLSEETGKPMVPDSMHCR